MLYQLSYTPKPELPALKRSGWGRQVSFPAGLAQAAALCRPRSPIISRAVSAATGREKM